MQEVRVTIDENGNVKLNVLGVGGAGCLDITKELEALLGGELTRELTSEYYQTAEVRDTQKVKTKA